MASINQAQDESESLHFLKSLAADRAPLSIPSSGDLAALAEEHKMHGLVLSAIESRDDGGAENLRSELAFLDGQTWARHIFISSELARTSSRLEENGVDHYVIKGPALESGFYDRVGERPFHDLDIVLLPPFQITAVLDAIGEPQPDEVHIEGLVHEGWIQSVDVTLPSGVLLDLHLDPLKLGFKSQFADSARGHLESMTVNGTTVATLDPTATLVVALIHLNRNRFRQLSGFADVVHILTRSEIDWPAFTELVHADGLGVLIDGSLRAVCDELDLDQDLIAGWTSRNAMRGSPFSRALWKVAWRPSTRLSGLTGRFRMGRRSQFLMPALCQGRFTWAVRWMVRRLFPPRAILKLNHPSATGPYLVRLVRGRFDQIRHNRFHRVATSQDSRSVDEVGVDSAD